MISFLTLSLLLSWVQVRSDTFVVKSSVGEDRARVVLRELEDFHQLVGTLVFDKVRLPELPIEVLLVGDSSQLKELAPERDGQPREFSGYYQRGQDRDFIVLSNRLYSRTIASVVYHELTHYFLSRALVDRPMWLSEGLAEYFATAEIDGNNIYVGGLSQERMQFLKTYRPLPLAEFLSVDQNSPHYNETSKANGFYSQAWAFVHFMQNRHAAAFRSYVDALTTGPADLFEYVKENPRTLQTDFENYVSWFIGRAQGIRFRAEREKWTMTVQPIVEAEAQMSISEILITMGRIDEARVHLEAIDALEAEFPRASYYRGLLARLSDNNEDARDLFVDALMDPQMGPRAAVSLVQIGEMDIPSVRSTLEQAARANTRMSDVYWALSEIYLEDIRRIQETVALSAQTQPFATRPAAAPPDPLPTPGEFRTYANGSDRNLKYSLLSNSSVEPALQTTAPPYYPEDLLDGQVAGKVIVDLQVTSTGEVGGVWLVSALPEVFGTLATTAVREWHFEPIPARIRVILEFVPD